MVQCTKAPSRLIKSSVSSAITSAVDSVVNSVNAPPVVLSSFIRQLDIDALNAEFAEATPQEILAWCVTHIPQGLVQTTSFSLLAITHMLYSELAHPVPVIFLDTLHLFPETLQTAQRAQEIYNLDLHTYHAVGADSREAFAERYGDRLWEQDVDRFYALTKVEPLARALDDLRVQAWITGRRRDQSEARKDLPIFEHSSDGRLKVNPLATWTRKEIWAYIFNQGVIYNPLHDQGYTSIGDQPLTTPALANEDERAGRWRGTGKTECGIHTLG
ncbi:MAG: phosphoadenosine phosphosulfate reductase [Cyanobacteria bacterium J06623_5]